MKNRVVSPKKLVVATFALDEIENPVSFNPAKNRSKSITTNKKIFRETTKNLSLFSIHWERCYLLKMF